MSSPNQVHSKCIHSIDITGRKQSLSTHRLVSSLDQASRIKLNDLLKEESDIVGALEVYDAQQHRLHTQLESIEFRLSAITEEMLTLTTERDIALLGLGVVYDARR